MFWDVLWLAGLAYAAFTEWGLATAFVVASGMFFLLNIAHSLSRLVGHADLARIEKREAENPRCRDD